MLGEIVKVVVDRPMGTCHPKYPELIYPVNYGYVPGVMAPDGEAQDAYILGVGEPVAVFEGSVIAIVQRLDDVEEKWVVAPVHCALPKEELAQQVAFQEQYFQSEVQM